MAKSNETNVATLDREAAVMQRYGEGARARENDLCCPVQYNPEFLRILPAEILERDYGCGDPSVYVDSGENVLDLGSGAGKICYILSQKVGPEGSVIGVDMNEEMLALARRHRAALTEKIGWSNVTFKKGRIQDLRTDLELVEGFLAEHPVNDAATLGAFENYRERMRLERPLVADASVDVVVSNCVLNLVKPSDKPELFDEIFRVLGSKGRAVISDIVADEDVPQTMQDDPDLWSGCIAGALREDKFLEAFEQAGFHGIEILSWSEEPWRVVRGIEFRSMTVAAYKGKQGPCLEMNQAVLYKGPYLAVEDDDGHRFARGRRIAVCEKTFKLLRRGPYAKDMVFIEPRIGIADPEPFDCNRAVLRHPRQSKGLDYDVTTETQSECCAPGDCC